MKPEVAFMQVISDMLASQRTMSQSQRPPTHAEDIAEYRREYAALGRDFHQDMTLVEYCGL
jgi:hypothetical protein